MVLSTVLTDEGFLHLVGIFLLSGVKFLGGLIWAIAAIQSDVLGWFVAILGGIFGSFIWIFLGHWIQDKWRNFQRQWGKPPPRRFNGKNRFLIWLKKKGGIYLLVLLSPLIISIPVGCLILSSMDSNRYRLLFLMSVSVLIWGTLSYLVYPYIV